MDKLFKYVGVSNLKGVFKARFANDSDRPTVLRRNGHTEIQLVELPTAMSKIDAVLAVRKMEVFANPDAQNAFEKFLDTADKKEEREFRAMMPRAVKRKSKKTEDDEVSSELLAAVAAKAKANVETEVVEDPYDIVDTELAALLKAASAKAMLDEPF